MSRRTSQRAACKGQANRKQTAGTGNQSINNGFSFPSINNGLLHPRHDPKYLTQGSFELVNLLDQVQRKVRILDTVLRQGEEWIRFSYSNEDTKDEEERRAGSSTDD